MALVLDVIIFSIFETSIFNEFLSLDEFETMKNYLVIDLANVFKHNYTTEYLLKNGNKLNILRFGFIGNDLNAQLLGKSNLFRTMLSTKF